MFRTGTSVSWVVCLSESWLCSVCTTATMIHSQEKQTRGCTNIRLKAQTHKETQTTTLQNLNIRPYLFFVYMKAKDVVKLFFKQALLLTQHTCANKSIRLPSPGSISLEEPRMRD